MSLDFITQLSNSQKTRLNKINIEKFYLIDKKTENNTKKNKTTILLISFLPRIEKKSFRFENMVC